MQTKNRIARKLVLLVVLLSTFITILTSAYQLYGNYSRDLDLIETRLNEIKAVHLKSLATRLWIADYEELRTDTQNIIHLPEIQYIEIIENGSSIIATGERTNKNIITRKYPVYYSHRNQDIHIGDVIVHATLEGVYQRLYDQIIDILVSNAIKTFLITGFILFIFHQLVTRHLKKIASFAETMSINNLEQDLKLEQKKAHQEPDELDIVVQALLKMQHNLVQSVSQLSYSKDHYQRLVESSSAIPWSYDLNSLCFKYIGPQIKELTGYSNEMFCKDIFWLDHIHDDDKHLIGNLISIPDENNICDTEVDFRIIGEQKQVIWIHTDIHYIKNISGKVYLAEGYMFDITKQKNTEIELQEYRNHLEKVIEERTNNLISVNKELESFSYSVSHDLRAPLRAIDGFSLALIEDYSHIVDADGQDYLQRVRRNTKRMSELIDDLLKLSRMSQADLKFTQISMGSLAKEIINNLKTNQPQRNVTFKNQADDIIVADKQLMRIVLENLLSNAWKYTGKTDSAIIEFGMITKSNEQIYYVKDNGAGFDMKLADKLFGPYQRFHADSEFEGNGIGLATVQRIVHRHNGRIWANAEVNQGATFYFTIPIQEKIKKQATGKSYTI